MTAPTGIGQYVRPQNQAQGDRVQAQQMVDRPMLLWVKDVKHINRTQYQADGGDGVIVDFIDLQTNTPYIGVMWMAGAIVDGLRPFVEDGNAYPVMIKKQKGGKFGYYNAIEPITEQPWLDHVTANFQTFVNLIAQTRAAKEQEWAAAMAQQNQPPAPPAPPAGPPTMTPMQVAANPQAGLYDQAMAMQPPHVQQALQTAPAAPAPVQQPPAPAAPPAAAPAAVAPPQAPAAPAAPPQQYAAPAYAPPAAPAAPSAPVAPPQAPAAPGVPAPPAAAPAAAPPGQMTNTSVAALQAQLDALG
ncbi:MAG TPA: hypothetical protein VIN75_05480 [Burkholderiaceae bacterium]